jgi:L-alanine-DL-glutamate epimerase-like enolase superfamily enzyme
VKVELLRATAGLRRPFVSASASVEHRELLLLRLEDAAGRLGFGEAAPLQDYDGVGIDECRAALEDCRGPLSDSDGGDRESLLAECARLAVLPQATAAVDLALWDLWGRRAGQPVWRLLGVREPAPVEVNYTIAAADRAGAAAEASAARRADYRALKLKVGTGDDAGRLAAVRAAAGAEMAIRIDANGAWSVREAEAALRALSPAGIELCEEPVGGLEQITALSSLTDVALAIDESSILPGALDGRVCQALCLKVSRCGGITGLLGAARRARAAGYELYLASTLDGPLGIAAALHAAAAVGPDRACGLATLQLFDGHEDPLAPHGGRIAMPVGPGLGDGMIGWYDPMTTT